MSQPMSQSVSQIVSERIKHSDWESISKPRQKTPKHDEDEEEKKEEL